MGSRRLKNLVTVVVSASIFLILLIVDRPARLQKSLSSDSVQVMTQEEENLQGATVVLTFPYLYQLNTDQEDYEDLGIIEKDQRMSEYISCLQTTLLHKHVTEVHLLMGNDLLASYVPSRIFKNLFKLSFHRIRQPRNASYIFDYVFKHLQNRLVMVAQADTYPETGFDLVDKKLLKGRRMMYALSRHVRLEDSCDSSGDFCDQEPYVGSHDAYIFVPSGSFPKAAALNLQGKTTEWGIDSVIVWTFKNILKYRVTNPCKIIYIYHRHCSFIRNSRRNRVNKSNNTGWAYPSNRLT